MNHMITLFPSLSTIFRGINDNILTMDTNN